MTRPPQCSPPQHLRREEELSMRNAFNWLATIGAFGFGLAQVYF
ncbi:hypothetical protein AAHH79_37855 [Burkholderia pseudomallei]